jgi:intergrase/recombinase
MFRHMNQAKFVNFNYSKKAWEWDLSKIAVMKINEDVIDFLLGELHRRCPLSVICSK